MAEKTRLQMLMRSRARPNRRRQLRQATLVVGLVLVVYCLVFVWDTPVSSASSTRASWQRKASPPPPPPPPPEILGNLSLDEEQCNAHFPGLTKEIDDVVAQGPFPVRQTWKMGPLLVRIKDGQVRACHYSITSSSSSSSSNHPESRGGDSLNERDRST
jgi:hypothetical protein